MRSFLKLLSLSIALGASLALPLAAQEAQLAFKGLKSGAGQPVEVTADVLEVSQKEGEARFKGHVIVTQGQLKLSSDDLLVTYVKGDQSKVDTLHATGNVLMSTPSEAAKASEALYTLTSGNLVMMGDVLLTQGQSVISGQKLSVDLNSGTGRMEGRVKTVLQTGTTTP